MWMIEAMLWLLVMTGVAIMDIRKRQVPELVVWAAGAESVLFHIYIREMSVWLILGGAAIGGGFLLVSKFTEEEIGYGDG